MHDFPPTIATDRSGMPTTAAHRPDTRSPSRLLWWIIRSQGGVVAVTIAFALLRQVPLAITPFLLGRVIDSGISDGDGRALAGWSVLLALTAVIGTVGIVAHHWFLVKSWLIAYYTTSILVTRRSTGLGHVLPRRLPTGEVLSVANTDADAFGMALEAGTRCVAAVITFGLVIVLMIGTSAPLGIAALIAAPVLLLGAAPILRPMQRAQQTERHRNADLTGLVTDIVAGLRILRGIGGERTFGRAYARQSQSVRAAGLRAMTWQALVEALGVMLAGFLLLMLTWLGAREVLAGELTVGNLVAFFGYAVFLMMPIATFFEFAQKWIRGLVSAQRTVQLFRQVSPWPDDQRQSPPIDWAHAGLHDQESGVAIVPGIFTVIATAQPETAAAIADRLGRYLPRTDESAAEEQRARDPWGVTAAGVDLRDLPLDEVRKHVLVSDAGSQLFAGTLQEAVDPHGRLNREQAELALRTAAAEDVLLTFADGWRGQLDERGRGLSGGQRQRLILARAVGVDPDVLILVEPTSAVDAHTEATIAQRLTAHRRGRTTVVVSASPLLLRVADQVIYLQDGRVGAVGTHDELVTAEADYRRTVLRIFDEEVTDA